MRKINTFLENDKILGNIMKYVLIIIVIVLFIFVLKGDPTNWQLVFLISLILIIFFGYDLEMRYGENFIYKLFNNKGGKNE